MGLGQESATIFWLEKSYMNTERKKVIVALEDLDFIWCENEAKEAAKMWRKGIPLDLIASNFGRDEDEVAVLLMHLARQNRISKREGGAYGRELDG